MKRYLPLALFMVFAAIPAAAQDDIQRRFIQAIQDAAVAEPSEIHDQLVAIRPDNTGLVWDGTGPDARVQVVTWMSEANYQRFWADPADLPVDRTAPDTWNILIWATAVPQVRAFCSQIEGDAEAAHTRLKQFLGLPPDRQYARFVEFWISPQNLRRPCPDSAIDDAVCELSLTDDAPADYHTWFVNNYVSAYSDHGMPWTRLGYTYDWAPASDTVNPRKPFGASEFIVRPGAPYTIAARYTTAEYCGKQ